MAKRSKNSSKASHEPNPTIASQSATPTSTGSAALVVDSDRIATLYVNEVPSSSLNLDNPQYLDFEYLRWSQCVIRALWQQPRPSSEPALRALHLGGAACALATALLVEFPNSHHTAVEIDAELANLVRTWLPLPRAPHLKIRVADARQALTSSKQNFDVIMRDAFSGATTPRHLTTHEFVAAAAEHLNPGGIYLANCADKPPLTLLANELATLSLTFAHTALIAEPRQLKGSRYGNVMLVASHIPLPESLPRELLKDPVPAKFVSGAALQPFLAPGKAIRDLP